jgi:hypothetical protein
MGLQRLGPSTWMGQAVTRTRVEVNAVRKKVNPQSTSEWVCGILSSFVMATAVLAGKGC